MNYRQKLGYTLLGAVIMLTGMAIDSILAPPSVAQRNGIFDEIRCSSLRIMNKNGHPAMLLAGADDLNFVTIYQPGGDKYALNIVATTNETEMLMYDGNEEPVIALTHLPGRTNKLTLTDSNQNQGVELFTNDRHSGMNILDKRGQRAISLSHIPETINNITVYTPKGTRGAVLSAAYIIGNTLKLYDANEHSTW